MTNYSILIGRIGILASLLLPIIIGGSVVANNIAFIIPQLMLFYCLQQIGNLHGKPGILIHYTIAVGFSVAIMVLSTTLLAPEMGKIGTQFLGMDNPTNQQLLAELQERINGDKRVAEEFMQFIVNKSSIGYYMTIMFVLYFASLLFTRFAYVKLGNVTTVKEFKTGSLLLLIGFPTVFLFGIGAVLMLVGFVFIVIGYFKLPEIESEAV